MPRAGMHTMGDFTSTPFDDIFNMNERFLDFPSFMFPSHSPMSPASPFSGGIGGGQMAIEMLMRMMFESEGMMAHPLMGGSRSMLGSRSGSGRGSRGPSSENNIAARMAALLSSDRDFGPEDYTMLLQLDATVQKRGVSPTEKRQFIRIRAATRHDVQDCLICQDKFKTGRSISVLTCKHEFCEECLDRWFAQNRTCPVCRKEVDAAPPEKPSVTPTPAPAQIRQRETNTQPTRTQAAPSLLTSHVPRPTFTARSPAPAPEFRPTRVVPSTASRVFGDHNDHESRVPPPARTTVPRAYDSGNYVPRASANVAPSVSSIPISDRPPAGRSAGYHAPSATRGSSSRTTAHRSVVY